MPSQKQTTQKNSGSATKNTGDKSPLPRRPALSHYRMALLGSEGIRKYYATGYIPDDLQD